MLVGSVAQSGSGTVVLSSSQNYVGTTTIQAGILDEHDQRQHAVGQRRRGRQRRHAVLAPTAGTAALSGASAFAATTFSYGGSGILQLSNSVTYTVGNGTPSVAVLQRSGKGTLIIEPSALADLGVSEKFVVVGLSSTANLPAGGAGIYNATVVAQSVSGNSDTGSFVAYSTTASAGFRPAAYTTRNANVLIPPNEITDVLAQLPSQQRQQSLCAADRRLDLDLRRLDHGGYALPGPTAAVWAGLILIPTPTMAGVPAAACWPSARPGRIYVGLGGRTGTDREQLTGPPRE